MVYQVLSESPMLCIEDITENILVSFFLDTLYMLEVLLLLLILIRAGSFPKLGHAFNSCDFNFYSHIYKSCTISLLRGVV